jgi:hypothetical protein
LRQAAIYPQGILFAGKGDFWKSIILSPKLIRISLERTIMTGSDLTYIDKLLNAGLINSPCLEMGVGYGGSNCKELIKGAGLTYFGTDMSPGKDVDFVANFEEPLETIKDKFTTASMFGSVLILNVLEHTFDPIRVLDNALALLQPKGTCIIITPTVWQLHDYPYDCWRINPNFYEQYCERRSLTLIREYFEYVGFHSVQESLINGTYSLPKPSPKRIQTLKSRILHKIFNTYGRGMFFPSNVATGVVILK